MAIAERDGNKEEITEARLGRFYRKPGEGPRRAILASLDPQKAAKTLGGLAHRDRLRIAGAILTGDNTHGSLAKSLKIQTGPLYHHLRTMERAGLLRVEERNRYDLTSAGRTALLITVGLAECGKDGRSLWKRRRVRLS